MEIVEKQPFGYPCLCGDIIRECPLIFMRGKYIQGRIDYCLLFFFGQMNVRRDTAVRRKIPVDFCRNPAMIKK